MSKDERLFYRSTGTDQSPHSTQVSPFAGEKVAAETAAATLRPAVDAATAQAATAYRHARTARVLAEHCNDRLDHVHDRLAEHAENEQFLLQQHNEVLDRLDAVEGEGGATFWDFATSALFIGGGLYAIGKLAAMFLGTAESDVEEVASALLKDDRFVQQVEDIARHEADKAVTKATVSITADLRADRKELVQVQQRLDELEQLRSEIEKGSRDIDALKRMANRANAVREEITALNARLDEYERMRDRVARVEQMQGSLQQDHADLSAVLHAHVECGAQHKRKASTVAGTAVSGPKKVEKTN